MGKLSHFFSKLFPSSNKTLFFSILQEKVCLFVFNKVEGKIYK